MNRKCWLIIFLLCSLILMVGGMHRPTRPADADLSDPVVQSAEQVVSKAASAAGEWQKAARENPQWILEIEAGGE